MLEVGQFFNKNGSIYGVLDIIKLDNNEYVFMSVEKNNKLDYRFYQAKYKEDKLSYNLSLVEDENLKMKLIESEEKNLKDINITDLLDNSNNENTSID